MDWFLQYRQHHLDIKNKRLQRAQRIASLPTIYHSPLTPLDLTILSQPIESLAQDVNHQKTSPLDILHAYGKAALLAHAKTNCLTEIMIPDAEASIRAQNDNPATNLKQEKDKSHHESQHRPLAGIPISLKDMINVANYDTSISMTRKTFQPAPTDAPLVRLLRDAGATIYVKTTVPITMLSFETCSPLWGTTTNPHNALYSPGGSSGGDAALIAFGGARVGIGSDLAGSVRVPAHFSGLWSLKCSSGRWPKLGIGSAGPGQEGVPSVLSPMARTGEDLVYFTRSVIGMCPWEYDHGVIKLPWREEEWKRVIDVTKGDKENRKRKLRIGIMWSDGVVDPSPACRRAIEMVVTALKAEGFNVFDVSSPPSPFQALLMSSQLINSDGGKTIQSLLRPGEWLVEGAAGLVRYLSLSAPIRWVYNVWIRYIRRDTLWADLLRDLKGKSCFEQWKLVSQRETYRARWFEWWKHEEKLDFLITAPNATPAIPHGAMREAGSSCLYAVLFNLLDYSSGVLPVTKVDAELDSLPANFKLSGLNGIARGAYMSYDAKKMHGLPVGVQVVGYRLEEEKVLAMMQVIHEVLKAQGHVYEPLDLRSLA